MLSTQRKGGLEETQRGVPPRSCHDAWHGVPRHRGWFVEGVGSCELTKVRLMNSKTERMLGSKTRRAQIG